MAWNPSPHVADCRDVARKWGGKEQVIILTIDGDGRVEGASYGETRELCACAKVFMDVAFDAIKKKVEQVEAMI